jgi:hypothetical protein
MNRTLSLLLVLAILLAGCITKNPQRLTPIPTNPEMVQLEQNLLALQMPSVSPAPLRLTHGITMPPMPPIPPMPRIPIAAPDGAIFYDPFNSGAATPWIFYQGSHLFTNGILRLTVAPNAGMYAYLKTKWTNVSVSADIKLGAGSRGAAVGLRYNLTNGASYQAWIYGSGRLAIEKHSNWYTTWKELAGTTITAPGTTTNNVKLAITNNILTAYLNNTLLLTFTDISAPLLMNGGGIDLSVHGDNTACTADFDNVTVYDLSVVKINPPVITAGLTNDMGIQGQLKTLSVTATGDNLVYLWRTPDGITAVGTNIYTITNLQASGFYTIIVTNPVGRAFSSAYMAMGTTNILTNCIVTPPPTNMLKTSVTLAWCMPDVGSNNAIGGYKIYYGSGAVTNWSPDVYDTNQSPCPGIIVQSGSNWCRTYTNIVDVGTNLTATVSNLVLGVTYYFAATCYDTNLLESDYSSEASYIVPVLALPSIVPLPPPLSPPVNVFLSLVPIGGGQIQLQAKVCPLTVTTILYQTGPGQPWNILVSNVAADIYGNFSYIDTPTDSLRFYIALLQ